MTRTRKYKYGRKLIHKKRTVSVNKIKRKTKIKSKKIKQKFKKSHMRYTKNGMKRRFQKGGALRTDINTLMTAYMRKQTSESRYQVTLNALRSLDLPTTEYYIELFQRLLIDRRVFGTTYDVPLEDTLLNPKLNLTMESLFASEEKEKYKDDSLKSLRMRHTLEKWTKFVEQAYKMLHPAVSNIDQGDIQLLKTRSDIIKGKMDAEKDPKLKDIYAGLFSEMQIMIIANKDAPPERKPINFFILGDPEAKRSAVSFKTKDYITYSDELYRIGRIPNYNKFIMKKGDKFVLDVKKITNPFVKEYLRYRLSDNRTGARFNNQENINMFNKKILLIGYILSDSVITPDGIVKSTGIDNYEDANYGRKLFLLLQRLDLIPVYTHEEILLRGDKGPQYDSVPDDVCSVSAISGRKFTLLYGRTHCRTCGRCVSKDETKTYIFDKVCNDCYELFSSETLPSEALSSEADVMSSKQLASMLSSMSISPPGGVAVSSRESSHGVELPP